MTYLPTCQCSEYFAVAEGLLRGIGKSAPIAQSGEHWIAELTGSESPVRAASALAVCS